MHNMQLFEEDSPIIALQSDMNTTLQAPDASEQEDTIVSDEERQAACAELEPNGCGGRGIWKGSWVPDFPSGFDFTEACNNHDKNYSTLDFGFEKANDVFLQEMLAVPPRKTYRFSPTGKMIEHIEKPDAMAKNYYNYVSKNGKPYYDSAQRNAYICKYGRTPS